MYGAGHSSLLVVCNRVYVKRKDDSYYPGVVQAKDSCGYTVLFADGSTSMVHESNLVWLGFWGLPAFSWPQHPVIQPCNPKDAVYFEGNTRHPNETGNDEKAGEPKSFRILDDIDAQEELRCSGRGGQNRACDRHDEQRRPTWARSKVQINEKDNTQHNSHSRSSVLRLNYDLLEMQSTVEPSVLDFGTNINSSMETEQLGSNNTLQTGCSTEERSDSEEANIRSCQDVEQELAMSNDLLINIKVEEKQPSMETKIKCSKRTRDHGIPLVFTQSTDISEIQPPYHRPIWNKPLPEANTRYKTNDSERLSTSTHQVYKEKQVRRSRRGGTKKCRRVFGVNNREAWCEHCKWKKACSRFKDIQDNTTS